MRRTAAAVLAGVLVLAAGPRSSHAQEAADPATFSEGELRRLRGILAWRRAAWRVDRLAFQRVVTELEGARAASAGPMDFTSLYLLGFAYVRLGRLAESEPVLEDARRMAPAFPGFLLTDGIRFATEKRTDEGLKALDEFVRVIPEYAKSGNFGPELTFLGLVFRGRLYARLPRHYDKAVVDLEEAMRVAETNAEPVSPEVVSLLAQMHQSLHQFGEAERLVRQVMARDPSEPSHYHNLGLLLLGQAQEDEAKPWFEAALARRADFGEAHLKLAYIASRQRELVAFRTHLEAYAAIRDERRRRGELPPDPRAEADFESAYGQYWAQIGDRRVEAGDDAGASRAWRTAKAHFHQALAREPGCVNAHHHLMLLGVRLGDPAEEIEQHKEAIRNLQDQKKRESEPYRSTFC